MSTHDPQPTEAPEDLEEVEVRPRKQRGAVISVRLDATEAQLLADAAQRAGMSVSEFGRNALRKAITSQWRIRVWSAHRAWLMVVPQETGGDYTRQWLHYEPDPDALVVWSLGQHDLPSGVGS
jgi:hypothetical protein